VIYTGMATARAESRCVTRALGPGLPDPLGKVNGDADVREIDEPLACCEGSEAGLQTGDSVPWS
jgi:hypothetical protein